jgi:transglycosylase-like protein
VRKAHFPNKIRILIAAAAAVLALCLGALAVRPLLERRIRARIEAEASRRGLVARMESVRIGLLPPLRLTGLSLEMTKSWRLGAGTVEAWWPGRPRIAVGHAMLTGPAGLTVAAEATTWDVVEVGRDRFRLELRRPQSGLDVVETEGEQGTGWAIRAKELRVGRLLDVRRFGSPLLDGGTVDGSLILGKAAGVVHFDVDLTARTARLPALAGGGSEPRALGEPTELGVKAGGVWSRPEGALEIPRWSVTLAGAEGSGSLDLHNLETDPGVDVSLDVKRVDFARLLRTSGLEVPENLRAAASGGGDGDLGSASLAAHAKGRISDPASFVVTQRLDFTPPRQIPPAIQKLRGDFIHEITLDTGAKRAIDVSRSSPDFIPLAEVPPLFLRALLIAEDAGFYSHRGIDLREMPAAVMTDWTRGGAARGGSTITMQLAKNLFLSSEKQLGRKLQELSVTFLLESALGKARILEIYLNIIEWGPELYGLRPAARAYFDREPRELTPAQMAFLVSLIPGPLKYQSSFAHGTPGPGFRKLVDNLLAKLRSVDALTEEEYRQALDEEIVVRGREAVAPPAGRGGDAADSTSAPSLRQTP